MSNVSSRTAMLVTDGSFSGGKADNADLHGTRSVHPDEFAILLTHLQPAAKKATAAVPRPCTAPAPASLEGADARSLPAAHVSASPAVVRAWARANGWDVGERGRLPTEITAAYRRAHEPLAGR